MPVSALSVYGLQPDKVKILLKTQNKKFMKYITILIDGAADYRLDELGGNTPLEYAFTPTIDELAEKGEMGLVKTVPDNVAPGSDTANLSVLGYDPGKYYTGRSSLEAASLGIKLSEDDVTFRCNLVTLSGQSNYRDKIMMDYSAGEITTEEARALIEYLGARLQTERIKFYPGISYRNIIVWRNGTDKNTLIPPHDITGKKISNFLPKGPAAGIFLDMMERSTKILDEHPVNKERIRKGLNPANSIWIWGEGKKPSLDNFYKKYGLKGSIISAVDLIKGIGILAGLRVVEVKGATGTINTNFKGKAAAAVKELSDGRDFVYLHVEAADECSHQGKTDGKVKAIETIDREIVKPVKEAMERMGLEYRILMLPDHYTPISLRTHTKEPVPFLIYDSMEDTGRVLKKKAKSRRFNEFSAEKTGLYFKEGWKLMGYFSGKKES